MEPKMSLNQPLMIGGAAVLAVILAAAAYFYFYSTPAEPSPEIPVVDVSAQVSSAVETPADKIPETNPFKAAETNPFKSYKNPF
ncbi:MAG: hypothetical protein AAB605_03330 [Patescibacteria group bacterium]